MSATMVVIIPVLLALTVFLFGMAAGIAITLHTLRSQPPDTHGDEGGHPANVTKPKRMAF